MSLSSICTFQIYKYNEHNVFYSVKKMIIIVNVRKNMCKIKNKST